MNPEENKEVVEQKNIAQKAAAFASSVASRGLKNNKTKKETKQLRQLSCHGDGTDDLPPCSQRKQSEHYPNSFYCGACGCGDKQGTQLVDFTINGKENYGKLDYPKVWCPLNMPGFQPYKPTTEEPIEVQNSRKKTIESRSSIEYIVEMSKYESKPNAGAKPQGDKS
jgi:hypothetical protein